jgi:serine/threonine protein kinase
MLLHSLTVHSFCYGMEFVDGGSVANLIRDTAFCKTGHHCVYYRLTHLKEPTIAYITYEILQVLHFLHEKGLFNRDLKGPNGIYQSELHF